MRAVVGLLHGGEGEQAHLVGLADFLERPADAGVAGEAAATVAIRNPLGWGKILLGILALLRRQNSEILENSDFFKY